MTRLVRVWSERAHPCQDEVSTTQSGYSGKMSMPPVRENKGTARKYKSHKHTWDSSLLLQTGPVQLIADSSSAALDHVVEHCAVARWIRIRTTSIENLDASGRQGKFDRLMDYFDRLIITLLATDRPTNRCRIPLSRGQMRNRKIEKNPTINLT